MANLTLSIDEELLTRARIRALEKGTSVNSLVREYLTEFVGGGRTQAAVSGFLGVAERSTAGSGAGGRKWSRDDIYGERAPGPCRG